jgi:hypothetical protein
MKVGAFEVCAAELEPNQWSFWIRGADLCPSLRGTLENQKMQLEWESWNSSVMVWFEKILLSGAMGLSLERLDATRVVLPSTRVDFKNLRIENITVSSFAYSHWLKLRIRREPVRHIKFAQNLNTWSEQERNKKLRLELQKMRGNSRKRRLARTG